MGFGTDQCRVLRLRHSIARAGEGRSPHQRPGAGFKRPRRRRATAEL